MNAWDMVPVSQLDGSVSAAGKAMPSPSSKALQPLALRSMFWRPKYSADSAWLEHVPFAFWLVEAHRPRLIVELGSGPPVLYFSFCQAIERLELESICVRVCGQKESAAGEAASEEKFRAYNASQYSSFSRLATGDVRAARHQFDDGSIDVLHIADAAGTLSSEDLADWMPKLSNRGVFLMHGLVEEQAPVTRRISANLRRVHPSFEFGHGGGLTLVAVGAEQPELVRLLCAASGNQLAKRALHDVFFPLGRACVDSNAVVVERATSRRLEESIQEYKRRVDETHTELRNAETSLSSRTRELDEARHKLGGQLEQRAAERGHLSEKITVLQEVRVDLKKQIETLQERADAASASLLARAEQVGRLEQAVALREGRIKEMEMSLGQRDAAIASLQARADMASANLVTRSEQVVNLEQSAALREGRISEVEASLAERDAVILSLQARVAVLERLASEKDAEHAAMLQAKQDLTRKVSQLAETVKRLQHLLQEKEAELQTSRGERDAIEEQVSALQADSRRSAARVAVAQQELADLTRFLMEAEQRNATASEERDLLARQAQASEVRIKAIYGRLVALQKVQDKALARAYSSAPEARSSDGDPLEEQCDVILRSGLFDAEWYLRQYPDIAKAGTDPLKHFLLHGATELRDPGPFFDTTAYVAANGGRLPEAVNPLLHYLASEVGPNWATSQFEVLQAP